ncbi:MAG TPA: hypothetical protein VG321_05335 [Solirubrobacteraceae bacterium]|jgi:hypothetical protein|nr:hypothetical protein [Solirubrobacteraceae bacterium]
MSETQLLLWLTAIHFIGFICVGLLMIPALRNDEEPPTDQDSGSSDDGWGNLPAGRPEPGNRPGGGLPLPDAEQSRIRLREPGRISEKHPMPQRRPVREPGRRPIREPATR